MEWIPVNQTNTTTDVANWRNKEEVVYWKARALTLEYENRMLLKHIRNFYAAETQKYVNNLETQQLEYNNEEGDDEEVETVGDILQRRVEETTSEEVVDDKKILPPAEQIGKKRREEMEKLYGKHVARIMGMETAIQLNYDKQMEQLKPHHWPVIPLNLKFE